jgi:hypothetical protein
MSAPRHARPANDDDARRPSGADLPEREASLWMLTTGPTIWALHFLLCYVVAATWCAKAATVAAPLGGARVVLLAATVAALAAIALFGWRGYRQHRHGRSSPPHDAATDADRHRFLGFATMLLCGLSLVAVLYVGLALLVIGTCR